MLRYILFGYALLAIFVAGGIFFKRSGKTSLSLSLFILLFGIEILDFLLSTSSARSIYPQFYAYFYFIVGFIYGPLLWWHFQAYLKKNNRFDLKEWLHFLPAAGVFFYLFPILRLPGAERISYIQEHFYDEIMPLNYLRAAHLVFYGLLILIFIYHRYPQISIKKRRYTWLVAVIYVVAAFISTWFTFFANTWRDFEWHYFVAGTIVIIIGWLLYTDPVFLKKITKKYLKSSVSQSDKRRIKEKIEQLPAESELFKTKGLGLRQFSKAIQEKPHHVSQTFSELFEDSFTEYVHRKRIEEAKKMLLSEDHQHFTIEAIALEAGFTNKVTFNRAFSKLVGQTPSQYRKAHQKKTG